MFTTIHAGYHPIGLEGLKLPKQFTFPFYYTPHPLCVKAAEEVQQYLKIQTDFEHNFGLEDGAEGLIIGKMFGVMLVETRTGHIGYLAGFSGKLGERNFVEGFVPPIFDTLNTSGFYKKGEHQLNEINTEIEALESAENYVKAKVELGNLHQRYEQELKEFKIYLKTQKKVRNQKREEARLELHADALADYESQLDKESIALHYKLKHLKLEWKLRLAKADEKLQLFEKVISNLKTQRKKLSAQLQRELHQSYSFLNAEGEHKDLLNIFKTQPPAAAGECAAPKLFQFAYKNELKPLAMAEFWWGASPKSQIRKHKQFYPACRSKCEPILGHMMEGLVVEPNPIFEFKSIKRRLDIVYEDNYLLVINKPEEVLSVPGKTIKESVLTQLRAYLPDAKGPILVHRLDMSTSGLLIAVKNEKTYKNIQKQFINRSIKKRYVAILDGEIPTTEGCIDLPLRVDLDNRPTQLVCYDYGKPAITKYKIIEVSEGKTRVYFYPITGRTHQLRVHAAHQLGLNAPIIGDDLYGKKGKRLHLHAEQITFEHPVKKEKVTFTVPSPF
ncbi:RNA pseudouridine synthase [Winogradskyella sp. DF17]|uniref:RNA pseudouridine synthase n=1 Tax=Winogradskyella pelagia TaxID=2819984 RepID=A0ABS3T3S2_9FLAO|nr:RluA family pseudouridine synthase [Winogradskyella sp. DF17]MBO3117388.1 RNA pseudouridine synthase [Winogradskyella sp. DF17]